MAGLFERMSMIVRSNVNQLLDQFEDPEKMVEQTILDATEEYAQVKKQSLTVLANENQAKKRLDDILEDAEKWHNIAIRALKAGEEQDARKALEKENEFRAQAEAQEKTYAAAKAAANKIREKLKLMEDELNDMKNKSAQIKATAATAKATRAAAEISQKGVNRGGFEAFARMEEKANRQLAEAEALESLNAGADQEAEDLEKKYAGGGTASADDALAKLKAELGM